VPIYEYRCENGHTFEVMQAMSEDPVTTCEICGAPVERVFHPVAVHFKGSGFYATDYAGKGKAGAAKDGDSGSASDSKSGDSKSGDSKPSDSKSDAKPSGGADKTAAGSSSD
jgi:putative FmdB family regulatory protein